ncbi:hypothetical protein [Gemmobacter caeruleus]|uniref:hypothetical protein n=1 Tax=Gemmobacter caeruleus TaxID=2595004 RepID=UPI0011F08A09|nr:hypothetical protein [Gemmobacter caeruleus]
MFTGIAGSIIPSNQCVGARTLILLGPQRGMVARIPLAVIAAKSMGAHTFIRGGKVHCGLDVKQRSEPKP